MNIIVNGQNQNISRVNLSMVLEELGYKQMKLATALNGDFISVEQRDNTELKDGDKLEILSPQQGGWWKWKVFTELSWKVKWC